MDNETLLQRLVSIKGEIESADSALDGVDTSASESLALAGYCIELARLKMQGLWLQLGGAPGPTPLFDGTAHLK